MKVINPILRMVHCAAMVLALASSTLAAELWIMDAELQAGQEVFMPVMIDETTNAASIMFQLNYDPQILQLSNVTNSVGTVGIQYTLFFDGSEDGSVRVILSRDDGAASGGGILVYVVFSQFSGAGAGAYGEVVIGDLEFGDQYGGGLKSTHNPSNQAAKVWQVMSRETDSDGDGLSDYDEQMLNGSPDYNPYNGDTDINNPDSDGDGIPDGWEFHNGLNPLVNDADEDSDGDGLSNYQEWIAGTSPTNGSDRFEIKDATAGWGDTNAVLHWNTISGRLYSVYSHTNLLTTWPGPVYQIPGDGTRKSYTNTELGSPLYFRLGVELNP